MITPVVLHSSWGRIYKTEFVTLSQYNHETLEREDDSDHIIHKARQGLSAHTGTLLDVNLVNSNRIVGSSHH